MKAKTKWVMNYPKRGQRTLFIDGKVAKSQVVPRGEDEPVVDAERPITRPMTLSEQHQHGIHPVRR